MARIRNTGMLNKTLNYTELLPSLKRFLALVFRQRVPALDDDKHVVDADAQHEKGHHGVHGPVEEAGCRADPIGDDNAHNDPEDADHGERAAMLHTVELAQGEGHIAEHQHVADGKEGNIADNGLASNIAKAASNMSKRGQVLKRSGVLSKQNCFHAG